MTIRYKHLMLIIGLAAFLPLATFARGEDPDDPLKKKKAKEDSLSIYEAENKTSEDFIFNDYQKLNTAKPHYKAPVNQKKVATKGQVKEVVAEETDNSAMSFNIIYYIIDTFKFTDPLE